jgi:hypothetical protein
MGSSKNDRRIQRQWKLDTQDGVYGRNSIPYTAFRTAAGFGLERNRFYIANT